LIRFSSSPADFTPQPVDYTGAPRLFEMRTYTTPEGKIAALDARFREHTVALFAKHGMTNLGYYPSHRRRQRCRQNPDLLPRPREP